jgi:signal transduction histidine kinase
LRVEGRGSLGEPAVVHILYPEAVWREARWQAAWPPLAVGAAALALVAILAFAVAGRLSRPILKLRTQLGGMAKGRFQALPLPERDDEIRDLMASVNSLAAQLRELEQAIQRAERLAILGQLSGGLIHHLRNDVTGARMAVQLHQRHCREEDQESMAVALRQLSLTEQHLQRFLATDVPQQPQMKQFDLRTVVDDLRTLLVPTCRHRKIDLQVRMCDEPVILNADPAQMRQMLLNLVLNGIDAACGGVFAACGSVPADGGWVKIEVEADSQREIHVRVLDSGPGVPSALEEKFFEPLVTGKPEGEKRFKPVKIRWVVEQAHACLGRCRRSGAGTQRDVD